MEESMKSRVILILAISTALFFLTSVSSCGGAHKFRVARDKEMATRLDLEESIDKSLQEKSILENEVKQFTKALEELKSAYGANKKALTQQELINQSLKEELKKVTKLKEALEEDLKEALVTSKGKPSTSR